MIDMKRHSHDFAFDQAQLGGMRSRSPLTLLASIGALALTSGLAHAQASGDAPVTTANSNAGATPNATDPGPPVPYSLPHPQATPDQTAQNIRDFEAAADSGRRAPLLGEFHGEVGATVGTNGLRGAYGHIVAHPTDNSTVDLRFSSMHENGLPYYGYGYSPGWRYRQGGMDFNSIGLGLTLGPAGHRAEPPIGDEPLHGED